MRINVRKKVIYTVLAARSWIEKLTEQQFQELEEKYSIFLVSKFFNKYRNLEEIDTF